MSSLFEQPSPRSRLVSALQSKIFPRRPFAGTGGPISGVRDRSSGSRPRRARSPARGRAGTIDKRRRKHRLSGRTGSGKGIHGLAAGFARDVLRRRGGPKGFANGSVADAGTTSLEGAMDGHLALGLGMDMSILPATFFDPAIASGRRHAHKVLREARQPMRHPPSALRSTRPAVGCRSDPTPAGAIAACRPAALGRPTAAERGGRIIARHRRFRRPALGREGIDRRGDFLGLR